MSKGDQIRRKLPIWGHLLKKSLMENFIFCAVLRYTYDTHDMKNECYKKINEQSEATPLTLSWQRSLSYKNHYIDLQSKSMDWFL